MMPALRGTRIELVAAGRGGRRAAHRDARRSSRLRKRSWASAAARRVALAGRAAAAARATAASRPLTRLREPAAARRRDGRDAADGARLALADAGGEAGGIPVEASFLDDARPGRPRLDPGPGGRERARGDPGLDRDRLPRRLRVRRDPGLAADHQRRRGCSRSRRRARAGDLVAPVPGSDELPDAQPGGDAHLRPGDPERPAPRPRRAPGGRRELGRRRRSRRESDGSGFGDAMVAGFEDALARRRPGPRPRGARLLRRLTCEPPAERRPASARR